MRRLLTIVLAAGVALGQEDPLETAAGEIKEALKQGNYIAVTNALRKATEIRWNYEPDELEPLIDAIGRGVRHKDPAIAIEAVDTLGKLRVPGSSKYLRPLLSVPSKVGPQHWNLYLAAIRAAGAIRDEDVLSRLERLVDYPHSEIGVAACEAIGQFASLERKARLDLIRRVADLLGRYERRSPRKPQEQIRVTLVKKALLDCVLALTRHPDLRSAKEVRNWLREEKKRKSSA